MTGPNLPDPKIAPTALVSPGAHVYGDVTLGPRVFLLFGAVVRAEYDRIEVGAETNIQDNSVLHCDREIPCVVGERVTIGHSAVVHGAIVGDGALIGIGAKVLNRSAVGEGALVAAGSVVTEDTQIPPWTLAVGAPARPRRELTENEILRNNRGVNDYLALLAAYREIL